MTESTTLFNVRARLNPHPLVNDDRLYVDLRITSKKNKNKTIDVSIYTVDGERLKIKDSCWSDGNVTGGFEDPKQITAINLRIADLRTDTAHYVEHNSMSTKRLIEEHLYGKNLEQWRSKRIVYKDVMVWEKTPTATYNELRKDNGKQKIITKEITKTVVEEFEVIKEVEKETVVDPLSLEDFPKNFNPDLYQRLKTTLEKKSHIRNVLMAREKFLKPKYMGDFSKSQEEILNFLLKCEIESMLFTNSPKEVVRVDKNVLKEYDKRAKKGLTYPNLSREDVIRAKLDQEIDEDYLLTIKNEIEQGQQVYLNSLLGIDERYAQGHFDNQNLFEVFISGFYLKYPNQINKTSIIWRLLEYKSKMNPSSSINDFSIEWCLNFLKYIFDNGVVNKTFKGIEPSTDLDKSVFEGNKIYYSKDRYSDILKWFKDTVRKLIGVKRLPKIDLDDITVKNFYTQDELKNIDEFTQDEKAITKPELDKLFRFDFSAKSGVIDHLYPEQIDHL